MKALTTEELINKFKGKMKRKIVKKEFSKLCS